MRMHVVGLVAVAETGHPEPLEHHLPVVGIRLLEETEQPVVFTLLGADPRGHALC